MRRKPSAYASLVLYLAPFAALAYLLTLLLGAVFDRDGSAPPAVLGGVALLGPFTARVLWYRRHTKVEFRLYEKGLVAVAANGREVVYPWQSTMVFTDEWDRLKLSTPDGTVVTLGPTNRRPALGGERIKGLRTRTVIRGAQVPHDEEWATAIVNGVGHAQLPPAADTALSGGEVAFGDLVLSRDGLTVRRKHGRDDFTTWEDVHSLEMSPEGMLMVSSRGGDFPTHFMRFAYRIPNLDIFLDLARRLEHRAARAAPVPEPSTPDAPVPDPPDPAGPARGAPAPADPAPADPAPAALDDELLDLLTQYLTFGIGLWAAWRLGTRDEIDGPVSALLAVVRTVLGGIGGVLFGLIVVTAVTVVGKVGGEILVESAIRWFRHRRYIAAGALALSLVGVPAALLFLLFRAFPSRLIPLVVLLFFGGCALLIIMTRCGRSERPAVRHLPYLPGLLLVVLACEQLVSGDVLTVAPAAGLFFPLALWISWRGWRWMKDRPRRTVQAAADVVLSVQLGLVLTLLMVWLANVLSFTPPQVTVVLAVVEKVQGLTEVHWLYWMAAYTVLAAGSYALLRWPSLVARVRRRLRPARFSGSRLPLGLTANFVQRTLSGINVGIMVALVFLVVVAPVSEGAWKRPVDERYALEVQRREYAEGSAAAYKEIHHEVVAHPRTAARIGEVIIAAHRIAPSPPGEPASRTALDIARQAGRFQAGTLDTDDPAPQADPAPEGDDLDGRLGQLDESQQQRAEREEQTDRFAELASLAITRALDTLDLGENQAVQLVKEYLGGLVEDGPVKTVFHRWGEGIGRPPPEGGRLVRIDVRRLTAVAYERTAAAVERADADLLAFYGRFGIGIPAGSASPTLAVDLANQHRYLRRGTGPCAGCTAPTTDGGTPGGTGTTGGGGRR
ncbi:hypothetical protein [Streptomyces parvus]|uniref:hypothetical protein n=1 Tax=Streptomyces parvus TaxID=66428 RepID=UPI00210126BB|nr:hypothetical protein [Streptomyces parvus]MCQ1575327.1 hypothetical protein [Streptomyces parvus]